MVIVLFKKYKVEQLQVFYCCDHIIHAHPDCNALNDNNAKEYYLEGYGSYSDGLNKINMEEFAALIKTNTRIDLL